MPPKQNSSVCVLVVAQKSLILRRLCHPEHYYISAYNMLFILRILSSFYKISDMPNNYVLSILLNCFSNAMVWHGHWRNAHKIGILRAKGYNARWARLRGGNFTQYPKVSNQKLGLWQNGTSRHALAGKLSIKFDSL